jgi:hypothetical protein
MNKEESLAQIREILEKSGIPKDVVDQWMKNPRAAAEQQKTDLLLIFKDKILELQQLGIHQQEMITEMQKQINELNAWKWRQEGK